MPWPTPTGFRKRTNRYDKERYREHERDHVERIARIDQAGQCWQCGQPVSCSEE